MTILPLNAFRRDCNGKCIDGIEGHYLEVVVEVEVYICLFVNIEIRTSGWHIQQSGVVLKTIRYQLV